MRSTFVLALAAAVSFAVSVFPALAEAGGTSEAAHICQQGGWQDWVRKDQTPFKNAGDCVSYAAQGGTLTEPTTSAQLLCESFGGVFAAGGTIAPDEPNLVLERLWTCTYVVSNEAHIALAVQCFADIDAKFGEGTPALFHFISGDIFGLRTDACDRTVS